MKKAPHLKKLQQILKKNTEGLRISNLTMGSITTDRNPATKDPNIMTKDPIPTTTDPDLSKKIRMQNI